MFRRFEFTKEKEIGNLKENSKCIVNKLCEKIFCSLSLQSQLKV